ncbi:hypothetical protein Scep_009680 [Stephania cephalantha]|uniref:DUF4005 domain-containing protein n=1 Tax=Stephania cephalantha TaxID=152367 RepID=A0AAP0JUF6_9MAGN
MGKTGKWIRNFLTGKKDSKDKDKVATSNQPSPSPPPSSSASSLALADKQNAMPIAATTPTTPKEKRRWSFRRSANTSPAAKGSNSTDSTPIQQRPPTPPPSVQVISEFENEQKRHAMAMAAATAAAADAAIAAAQAVAAVIRLTAAATEKQNSLAEEAAAIKIQSVFRSYLARKALCALKGLVKLQALVRGHLVRKQAAATLRCMQALVTLQAKACAQRVRMLDDSPPVSQRPSTSRKSVNDNRIGQPHNELEENVKIVEMDLGALRGSSKGRNSYSGQPQVERIVEPRFSTYYSEQQGTHINQDHLQQLSPAPSALTDMSPRTCSGHFEEYYSTAQSSPHFYSAVVKPDQARVPFAFPRPEYPESLSHDYPFFPNYMANTESSRAKVRSHSAPKQRPDTYERQPSRRRASIEGRNIPRAVRMQRSSSHVGASVQGYQYPWSMKLDRSTMSLKDSECGSTSTVLTNTNYCRSIVSHEVGDHHLKE